MKKIKEVISTCIYCGCGCKLVYKVKGNNIIGISGYVKDYMSEGIPCIKGLTIHEVWNKNRITKPLVRKNGKLKQVSWSEAIEKFYSLTKDLSEDEIFLNGSGKITNEANFMLYKLGVGLLKTNNIDSCCGRLCHISTVKGLSDCYGHPNLTLIDELDEINCLFIIGSNPAINYPVFWNKVLRKKRKEGYKFKIISVQSLLNLTSRFGDIFLEIEPGTEVALLNGIIHYLLKENKIDKHARKLRNFKKLVEVVKKYPPSYVARICKIKEKDFIDACKEISNSKLGIFHGMGFTQHKHSLDNIYSLINLALLKNARVMNLRGEINVQGVGDVFNADIKKLSRMWKINFEKPKGNLIKSLIYNPVNLAIITEFNPAQSLPDLNKVHKILSEINLVYLGSYFNLTCEFADLIIPVPALFETKGTITNGEQRIRLVNPVIKSNGLEIWQIAKLLAKKFNKAWLFNYKNAKQIFSEIVKVVPYYKGIDPEEVYKGKDVLARKWIKHRVFMPVTYKGKDDRRTKAYPFLLTTFREQHHFLTSEVTDASKTLQDLDKDRMHVFINPKDAEKLKVKDEDKIIVKNKKGFIEAFARISEKVPKGLVATRFHYKEMLVNRLFPLEHDPITYTPDYKCCAVRIEKVKIKSNIFRSKA